MDLALDDKFQLLDTIGVPKNNLLFSSLNDLLIYSIGSNIIIYNLKKNIKTFLQNYYTNEISIFKFLDKKEQLLLIINKGSSPFLSIWKLPFLEEIYSQEIFFENDNINFKDIYIEKIFSNLFIIIITAIDCNFLYILKHDNFTNFKVEKVAQISNIPTAIEGFKCFYDDIYLIFIVNNNLLYYLLDPKKIFFNTNNNNQEIIKLHQKFTYPFNLKKDSLQISDKHGLIFFLTSKGNCLVYNKKGESIISINPLNKEENFTSIFLDENSLCLGTDKTKIYIYTIINKNNDNFKLKYFIKEQTLKNIKLNFQLNNNSSKNNKNNNTYESKDIIVEYININQKLDKIFIKLSNNSFLYVPLSSIMDDSQGIFYFNSLGNKTCLYSYNHSEQINTIEINNNYNEFETIIYSCSKDNTLIQYKIDFSSNKLSNLYFDLNDILKTQNEKNENDFEDAYLTVIKFSPIDNTKLFAGDNKGNLYIFKIKENYFQYKKYYIDDNSIEFISFSKEGNLICLGLLTGKQLIFDLNKNCELCLKLNGNYLNQDEIDFRISNYHVITYNYFFGKEKHKDCILFMKNTNKVEYSKLFYEKNGKLNKKKITLNEFENDILDIKIHVSENYLIILNDKNQIIINEINLGETTAVIDLSDQTNKIYNFYIDQSGLYICIICSSYYSKNCNDLIFIEIGTGSIASYIKCIGKVFKIFFDYYSKYIITGSHDGILSLWKIPKNLVNIMINTLSEMEKNENYWEQFEIKYYINNKNNFIDEINDIEMPRKLKTEISFNKNNKFEEVEDNGPHKGIQTWQNDNIKINKEKNQKNQRKFNNNNSDNYSLENGQNTFDKNININTNNKNDYFPNYENNINYNSYIPNTINNKPKIKRESDLDKNIREENTLQNCYEKFKKERLMRNSFAKPNNNNNKNINNKNIKENKIKNNNKVNYRPFSSERKISNNKKYLNQPAFNNYNNKKNKMNLYEKEKYNKKENDSIDFEIDFDINKIRPNFDPNLYSEQGNKKYSLISKELIKPYLINTLDKNKKDYLRHIEKDDTDYNNKISNKEYSNFISSNTNNNLSISNKNVYKSNNSSNKKINDAMNVLMEKTGTKNSITNQNNNINSKSISSKSISHDFAYINNVKIEPSKLN